MFKFQYVSNERSIPIGFFLLPIKVFLLQTITSSSLVFYIFISFSVSFLNENYSFSESRALFMLHKITNHILLAIILLKK